MGVFIGEAEADQDARHLEGVVHLRYEGDGTAFANENGLFAKALLERGLRFLENWVVVGSHPGLSHAQNFKLAVNRCREELANVLLDEPGDLLRFLVGHEARGEFSKSF